MRKQKCDGTCKRELPHAITLSTLYQETIAAKLKERPWLAEKEAERIAEQICQLMILKNWGFGYLMWQAGNALAHCERCWRDYCVACFLEHSEGE